MIRFKKTVFVVMAAIFGIGLFGFYQTREIVFNIEQPSGQITVKMSRWEVNFLESFFRHGICADQWAYTLFGYKPMSLGGKGCFGSSLSSVLPPAYCMREGWRILQKLQLPHPHFVIWCETASWSEDVDFIFIAHKDSVTKILQSHSADFYALLHLDYQDADGLFQDISQKSLIRDKLNKQEALLGILLGYGRENAYLFCEVAKNKADKNKYPNIWDQQIERPIIDSYFRKLNTFRDPDISDMFFPHFIAYKNSSETIALKLKYLEARQKIINYYQDKSFLEATLSLLVNGPPEK